MSYRTDTKALVLAVLAERPMHGYAISKAIREISSEMLKLGEGQLYPILRDLEENNWVTGEWEMQEGDPPRKVYRITDSGRTEFARRSKRWLAYADAVHAVMISPKLETGHE